jgi:hypothetical protein
MSKRLQVVVDDDELRRYAEVARVRGLTLSAWARQTLRAAEREVSTGSVEKKLAAIDRAYGALADDLPPAPDIETMLAEIEQGYLAPIDE